jgi:hypothetical protein
MITSFQELYRLAPKKKTVSTLASIDEEEYCAWTRSDLVKRDGDMGEAKRSITGLLSLRRRTVDVDVDGPASTLPDYLPLVIQTGIKLLLPIAR